VRRFLRALVVFFGAIAALVLGLVLAILLWAFSALKADLSPPDPSAVPPTVLGLFRTDLGSSVSDRAARFLIEQEPIRQLHYTLAGLLARSWIEYRWSEDEALAQIALHTDFGQGFYGVHEAARGYFGVPAEALTVPQAAALVALTWSPSGLSPWCHPDRNLERVRELLASSEQDVGASLEGLLAPAADACVRQGS
jgi:Transglycosylase